jgi:alkanesulfonate monooxygenase SsuD/methylene tetrahydromethanopterin reductase-like flavin-dependent oxidoreductase (luciferase family)
VIGDASPAGGLSARTTIATTSGVSRGCIEGVGDFACLRSSTPYSGRANGATASGWPPLSRAQFDQGPGPRGHLMVGTPDEAIAKILAQHEVFHHDRYLMQMAVGAQAQDAILRSIELLGTVVAPKVRAELAKRMIPG